MRTFIALAMVLLFAGGAMADIVTKTVEYKQGDAVLEGYLAYPGDLEGEAPGVLVVHQWKGIGDYERERVEQLAGMGYVAFAADIYGKGIRPETTNEAAEQAGIYRGDRALMRARANAGLDYLRSLPQTDDARLVAIGYCFGGGTVLELARSGAELAGVVSFHGNLDTPDPSDAKAIKAKVLVCHGAADPFVGPDLVAAFQSEMNAAEVDWQLVMYGGAVHAFTDRHAGNSPATGVAYDAKADARSWTAMKQFFSEIF
jgi:dienelactone hydrolase